MCENKVSVIGNKMFWQKQPQIIAACMHIFIIIIYHHQDAQPGGEHSLCVLQSSKPRPRQAPPNGRRRGFLGPVKIEYEM